MQDIYCQKHASLKSQLFKAIDQANDNITKALSKKSRKGNFPLPTNKQQPRRNNIQEPSAELLRVRKL